MSERITIKSDGSWEFRGEDSRLRDPEKNALPNYRIRNPLTGKDEYRTVYRVYCMNCGGDGGISARESVYVKYICDDCFYVKGIKTDNFIPMLPDEEFRWRNGLPARDE